MFGFLLWGVGQAIIVGTVLPIYALATLIEHTGVCPKYFPPKPRER